MELLDDNDLGFQTLNSFGLGYRLVGTDAFKTRVLDGADSLYNFRYDVRLDQIHLWTSGVARFFPRRLHFGAAALNIYRIRPSKLFPH